MRENPSSLAMALRPIEKEFPASAPEPMGQASALVAACSRRVRSRANTSAWASKKCESSIGCACCRRSEEHTSELQSRLHLVCRLLLEKKKRYASTHDSL